VHFWFSCPDNRVFAGLIAVLIVHRFRQVSPTAPAMNDRGVHYGMQLELVWTLIPLAIML